MSWLDFSDVKQSSSIEKNASISLTMCKSLIKKIIINFICLDILPACVSVHHMNAMPAEARRECSIPATVWVLEMKPRFSRRSASALNHPEVSY